MAKHEIWLEFDEQELILASAFAMVGNEDEDDGIPFPDEPETEDIVEDGEELTEEDYRELVFEPIHLYINPIVNGHKIDIDFDPKGFKQLHLVVVFYDFDDEHTQLCNKWFAAGVYQSRREAKEIAFKIEDKEYEGEDMPWSKEFSILRKVQVFSLPVEE